MRIIKRYSNRKLYDTEDKRYITLEQIAQLVRDGQDIKVVENTDNCVHVTLPACPDGHGDLSDAELHEVAAGGGTIPTPFCSIETHARRCCQA